MFPEYTKSKKVARSGKKLSQSWPTEMRLWENFGTRYILPRDMLFEEIEPMWLTSI